MLPYHPHYSGQWCGTKQRGLSTLGWGCPSQTFKMPPRAGTFPKDLISNSAYKLLSGNLPFPSHTACLRQGRGKWKALPSPTRHKAARAWRDTCLFPTGKAVQPHRGSSRRQKRKERCEKRCRTITMILKFRLCGSPVPHKKHLLSFLPPTATPTFPAWWVSGRQRKKKWFFFLWSTATVKTVNFKITTWTA